MNNAWSILAKSFLVRFYFFVASFQSFKQKSVSGGVQECKQVCVSVVLTLMHIWAYMCVYSMHTLHLCSIRWQCSRELLASFHLTLKINSCFNLYTFFKDLLCWGFTPSDLICLLKGSSHSCVCIYPLCIANLSLQLYADIYLSFNCVKMEHGQS